MINCRDCSCFQGRALFELFEDLRDLWEAANAIRQRWPRWPHASSLEWTKGFPGYY